MKAALPSLQADLAQLPGKWRVHLRDAKSGKIMPVLVPESDSAHKAISAAINRAARFLPNCDWRPVSAHRTL